ncbi:MAG: hypothetical protein MRY81_11790 [Donghicola eburneus]|nr:hypothetical protein [Donghicola eburneus]MCI5040350.1 hypothetical protein [Donghicola eburneus]
MAETSIELSSEEHTQSSENLMRAWMIARNIVADRNQARLEQELVELREELEGTRADCQGLRRSLDDARSLLAYAVNRPVVRVAENIAALGKDLSALEGEFQGAAKTLQLQVLGMRSLMFLGRIRDLAGIPSQKREALVSFRFLDGTGQALPSPRWVRQSEIYGDYRYISPDENGWFEQAVSLPEGTATLELSVHDFRKILYAAKGHDSTPFTLSDLEVVSTELLTRQMLTRIGDTSEHQLEREGVLQIGPEGVTTALSFQTPRRALQFSLDVGLLDLGTSELIIEATARSGEAAVTQKRSYEVDGRRSRFDMSLFSETPFTQVVVRISAKSSKAPILLLDQVLDDMGTYPDREIFNRLNCGTVPVNMLEVMADDWEARGKWFCVHEDLPCYEAPLALVCKLPTSLEPLALNYSFSCGKDVPSNRKGMVLSLFYFDEDGNSMPLSSPEFAYSASVGHYRYVPTSSQLQDVLSFLPLPAEQRPTYLAICVQGWNNRDYDFLSATPTLAPSSTFSAKFEETMMAPSRDSDQPWFGVYARSGTRTWKSLRPNFWRKALDEAADEINIRLGGNELGSVWAGIDDTLWSPGTKKLRAIIAAARQRKIPVKVDITRFEAERPMPFLLLTAADQVIATSEQADRIRGAVPFENILVK